MPKLDSNIYGADPVGIANEVSSAALAAEKLSANAADYWNNTIQDARSQAEANVGKESLGPTDVTPTIKLKSEDVEKLGGFKVGKTATGHDTGQKQSPSFKKQPGAQKTPLYGK
jgi:hypothetical protein